MRASPSSESVMAEGTRLAEFRWELTEGFESKMRTLRERLDCRKQRIEDQLREMTPMIPGMQQVRINQERVPKGN